MSKEHTVQSATYSPAISLEKLPLELVFNILHYCKPAFNTVDATRRRMKVNPFIKTWRREKNARDEKYIYSCSINDSTLAALSLVNKNFRRICFPILFHHILCYSKSHLESYEQIFTSPIVEHATSLTVAYCHPFERGADFRTALFKGLSSCNRLTELFIDNFRLDGALLRAITSIRSLKTLSITRTAFPSVCEKPYDFKDWSSLPPVPNLYISPPVAADASLIDALKDTLENLHLNSSHFRLGLFDPFFCTLGLHKMTFPKLKGLRLERVSFCRHEFRKFLRRHRVLSLEEINVSAFAASYSLGWVARALSEMTEEDWEGSDDDSGTEDFPGDDNWGKYGISVFGCVVKSNVFTQLGLSFALATNDVDPLDELSPLIPFFKKKCFRSLEALRLAADPYFVGVLSEFAQGVVAMQDALKSLKSLTIGWNTHGYGWEPRQILIDREVPAQVTGESAVEEMGESNAALNGYNYVGEAAVAFGNALMALDSRDAIVSSILIDGGDRPSVRDEENFGPNVESEEIDIRPSNSQSDGLDIRRDMRKEEVVDNPEAGESQEEWAVWEEKSRERAREVMKRVFKTGSGRMGLEEIFFHFGRQEKSQERVWEWRRASNSGVKRVEGEVEGRLYAPEGHVKDRRFVFVERES